MAAHGPRRCQSAQALMAAESEAESVRVVVRARPCSEGEAGEDAFTITGSTVSLPAEGFTATYASVLGADATNEDVYGGTAQALVPHLLDGINVTVFAYGATGSGKTHTMLGPELDGVIPRFAADLFAARTDNEPVRASFLEVYNKRIFDLLASREMRNEPLQLRGTDSVYVEGLTTRTVSSAAALARIIAKGQEAQHTRATDLNPNSSRSHSVLTLHVGAAKAVLVDLAGSENVKHAGISGDGLREASEIHGGLAALGSVVAALHRKQAYVPYRDSKITRLLQDSLGGTSRTVMICTVGPDQAPAATLNTLKFATRVACVENTVTRARARPTTARDVELGRAVTQRDAALQQRDAAVAERDAVLREADRLRAELDAARAEIEAVRAAPSTAPFTPSTVTQGSPMSVPSRLLASPRAPLEDTTNRDIPSLKPEVRGEIPPMPDLESLRYSVLENTPPTRARSEETEADIDLSQVPLDADGRLTSIGSICHAEGGCRPCIFANSEKGKVCANGVACAFCHFSHTPRKRPTRLSGKRRMKQRKKEAELNEAQLEISIEDSAL